MNHLQTLKDFNAWRRIEVGSQQPNPKAIGEAIDWAIRVCEAAQELKQAKARFNNYRATQRLYVLLP